LHLSHRARGNAAVASDLDCLGQQIQKLAYGPRPRPTVIPSMISAINTKTVISRAVKNSPMAEAATSAMVMESSMVMRPFKRSPIASLKIGNPPIRIPASATRSNP
jgi:hypothetical protein